MATKTKKTKFLISKFLVLVWINVGSPSPSRTSGTGFFTPIVSTLQGKVRGLRSLQGQNRYYSIPYAVAERFQLPKETPNWNGVYDAFNPVRPCAQNLYSLVVGTEDCLCLDVYTPGNARPSDKLPILIFLHGGAYYYGGKTVYNGEFLVSKNVIVVSINYRLGVNGFLCINGVSNLGLRDQVAAFKWVQRNIAAFGGDPDNVTLCGQSAGAAAVAMHFLSKESEGLFHKAILMSGSVLSPWAFNMDPIASAWDDARKLDDACTENDIYNTFLNASLIDLIKATKDSSDNPKGFKYSPCVDSNSTYPFFHDKPHNIMKSGAFKKVPTLIGSTDSEGLTFYGFIEQNTFEELDKNFIERISSVFSWCSDEDRRRIANIIRSYYFGNDPITKNSARSYVNYFADAMAYGTVHAFSKLLTELSDQPVFNYQFSYSGERNFLKSFSGLQSAGATHGDELFYLFKPIGFPLLLSNSDKLIIDRTTTLFSNFMKFGNPTPVRTKLVPILWPPGTANATNTLLVDKKLSIIETPRENFYTTLLCEYGESGYVPCDSAEKCNRRKRTSENMCYKKVG